MNAFVLSGLIKRRAELAGDIEKTHEALRKMVLDLENIDATILQFDPDFKVEMIRPKAFRRRRIGPTEAKCPGSFSAYSAKPQSRLPAAISRYNYLSISAFVRRLRFGVENASNS
jgi:hypothetical protein